MTRRRSAGGWSLAPITNFKGLNLLDQPEGISANEALDNRNVVLTDHGGVRSRDGYALEPLDLGAVVVNFMDRFESATGVEHLVHGTDTLVTAAPTDALVLRSTPVTSKVTSIARISAPGTSAFYAATGLDTLRRFEPTAGWTVPVGEIKAFVGGAVTAAALPKARVVGVWPGEERLVCAGGDAGPGALAHSKDTVWFSQNALPQRFLDTDFVTLGVGDGEEFTGIHAWRDQLFVFKKSRFWVFTNTTTDARGVTIFQRRNVEVGVGPVGSQAIAVGRDGVYFVGADGLYRTRGGDPELLTQNLEPLWRGPGASYFTGGAIDSGGLKDINLEWLSDQLYMSYRSTLGAVVDSILQFDTRDGRAALWSVGASALGVVKVGTKRRLWLGTRVGRVGSFVPGLSTDDGATFASWWLGGFFTPNQERVVRHRRMAVWGQGRVNVGLGVDYKLPVLAPEVFLGSGGGTWGGGDPADTWGDGMGFDNWEGSGVLGSGLAPIGVRGSRMALRVGATPGSPGFSAPWLVTKVVLHLSGDGPRVSDVIHA